jgi:hypothetical protein
MAIRATSSARTAAHRRTQFTPSYSNARVSFRSMAMSAALYQEQRRFAMCKCTGVLCFAAIACF